MLDKAGTLEPVCGPEQIKKPPWAPVSSLVTSGSHSCLSGLVESLSNPLHMVAMVIMGGYAVYEVSPSCVKVKSEERPEKRFCSHLLRGRASLGSSPQSDCPVPTPNN